MFSWQGLPVPLKDTCAVIRVVKSSDTKELILLQDKSTGRQLLLRNFPQAVPDVYKLLNGKTLPYVPRILAAGQREGGSYVLEEYIEGKSLRGMTLGGRELLTALQCICAALTALHELDIVHRDVKPENIVLSDDGRAHLIDLDTARIYKRNAVQDTDLLGTAGFAAPEQFGIVQTDHRADIFSLGITLNVLLTGSHPAEKLCTGPMRRVILKCTQIDPSRRYQSADEVLKSTRRAIALLNLEHYKKQFCIGAAAAGLVLVLGGYALHSTAQNSLPTAEPAAPTQTEPLKRQPAFDLHRYLVPHASPAVKQDRADSAPDESTPAEMPSPSPVPDFIGGLLPTASPDLLPDPTFGPIIGPVNPSASPRPTLHPFATPTPGPSASPSPKPTLKPSPSPTPTAAPTPAPTPPPKPEGYDEALALKQEYDRRCVIAREASDKYYAWIEEPYNQKYKQYQAACDEQNKICDDLHIETVLKQEKLQELQQNDPDNTEAIRAAQAEYDEARRIEEEANFRAKPARDALVDYLNSSEYLIGKREEDRLWNDMQEKEQQVGEALGQLDEVKGKYDLWLYPELMI